ncbi:MAG: leucine-rich repeat protein [Acetobacterium sp.]|nr:leucine-rich repeat protein [Acetobacterium sp.]
MKKGLKKALSLLVISLMLTSIVPASVIAVETEISGSALVQTGNNNGNSQEEAFVFENGQAIWLSNTTEEVPMKAATSQSLAQLKEEPSQNAILNSELQTDSIADAYEVTDIDGGVSITKYTGIGGDVVVPATLDGKVVLEIGEKAFYRNDSLISITLPEGLKKIGRAAFFLCSSLTTVSFPESLEVIDRQAFGACDLIKSISLPQKVLFIDGNPFDQCHILTSISVSPLNPNYQVLNGLLVDKTGKTLIVCPGGAVTAIIPEGITAIGDSAFRGCRKITNIDLPESVISIGSFTFFYSGLTSINLPKGVASIGSYSFAACDNLTSITVLPGNSSFASIDGLLFDKDGTTLIACPAGKTSVILPISVTEIGNGAFYDCDKLTVINLPENVKNIGDDAFGSCRSLTNLVLPEGTTEIGYYAFRYCKLLTKVVIPASVKKIGTGIFSDTPLGTIYGVYGSCAETYANANNIPFVGSGLPTATLESIAITTAAAKWSYNIGDTLDLTGLVVTGTYSDGTTKIETITAKNVTGFDSSKAVGNQVLTITLNGKTAAFTIQIIASEDPGAGDFTAFLGQGPTGNYYEYKVADFNNSYLAYQIKPTLPSAKMYQQFLNSKCRIVALKDLTKGYMDYSAAATASLMVQMKGEAFDINAYFGRSDAKRFAETVDNVKIVDQDGNVS